MGNEWAIPGADGAFMNAFNSPNVNAYALLQQYQNQMQQMAANGAASAAAPTDSVSPTNPGIDPSFKGNPIGSAQESSGSGLIVAGGIAAGALTVVAACKGKGNLKQGFKMMWESCANGVKKLFNKGAEKAAASSTESASTAISNLIKDGGKNLKEYTIKRDGLLITIKDGKPIKIVTETKQEIKDITKWLTDNPSAKNKINGLDTTGKLTKDIKFDSYIREISHNGKNYKVILDKSGKAIDVSVKDAKGKWNPVSNIEEFLGKNKALVEKAETMTYTDSLTVHLKNSAGNYTGTTKDVELSIRNGEIVGARYKNGTDWVDIEDSKTLEKLKNTIDTKLGDKAKDGVPKFNRDTITKFGLKDDNCVYTYTTDITSGGKTVQATMKFSGAKGSREIHEITTRAETDNLTTTSKIDKYLTDHSDVKSEIEKITSSGELPTGYKLSNANYVAEASGNKYVIENGKIKSITIKDGCTVTTGKKKTKTTFSAGTTLTGNDIDKWQTLAVNGNEYNSIKEMLKT